MRHELADPELALLFENCFPNTLETTVDFGDVDGFGNRCHMDDTNVPSLLSLPYLGACAKDDPSDLTRPWFAWANTLFGDLILTWLAERSGLVRG